MPYFNTSKRHAVHMDICVEFATLVFSGPVAAASAGRSLRLINPSVLLFLPVKLNPKTPVIHSCKDLQ